MGKIGLIVLWLLACLGCGGDERTLIVLSVSALSLDVDSLQVSASVEGAATAVEGGLADLPLQLWLPGRPSGSLKIDVRALRRDRCVVAEGYKEATIQGAARIDLAVALILLPAAQCALTMAREGGGRVLSMPSGVDCGEVCAASFAVGSPIKLSAEADVTSDFAGWSGLCSGKGPCEIILQGPGAVQARFVPRALSVNRAGRYGTITSDPPGIDCGTHCSFPFPLGTVVRLLATPHATARFTGWSGGGCRGTEPCEVTFMRSTRVTASFGDRNFCPSEQFCWENPLPQGNRISGIWGASKDDMWMIGDAGVLLRWDGAALKPASLDTTEDLRAVWGAAPDDIWAASDQTVVRWDGVSWAGMTLTNFGNFFAIWGSSAQDVWFAAEGGLAHWDGTQLYDFREVQADLPDVVLTAVWGSAPDDVWAVGPAGAVLHYDGSRWDSVPSGTAKWLYGVWGSANDDVWAVGEVDALLDIGTLLHWDGTRWTQVPGAPAHNYSAVWGTDRTHVWAATDGPMLHYDGTAWREVSAAMGGNQIYGLNAIFGTGADDVWAAGAGGALLRWNGSRWTPLVSRNAELLFAVWGSRADDVWAVGFPDTLLHWDGARWTPSTAVTGSFPKAVWGWDRSHVWLAGDGIYFFDGASWRKVADGGLNALWGSAPNDVWAVGGETLHWDGARWTAVSTGARTWLSAVWGSGPSDVWAAGERDLLHWDGTRFSAVPTVGDPYISSLWGSAPQDVWAVGLRDMLHFDGSSWKPVPRTEPLVLYSVWGAAKNNIWAAGQKGAVLHFDGLAWSPINSGTRNELWGLWGLGDVDLWMVGESGAILRYRP